MSRRRPLDLQRLRNVNGEMLRSRDFRERIDFDLELHRWHQRAVHQAFGVASGLDVSDPQGGQVTVAPGVAYDASGRDLILLQQTTIDLPTSGPAVTLLLRRCGTRRDAKLGWTARARLDPCDGVALAQFDPSTPGTITRLATAARSLASPRIGTGSTSAVATPWELWQPLDNGPAGIEVRVDTRAAGFTDLPRYFAALQWPRVGVTPATAAYYALGLQYVQDEAVDAFTFRVLTGLPTTTAGGPHPANVPAAAGDPLGFARAEQLYVCWMGVQCDAREQAVEQLKVTVGSGDGSVTGDVGGINVQTGDPTYIVWLPRGTEVTLTAQPAAGAGFNGWTVDGPSLITPLSLSVSMTRSRSVTAFFSGEIG